MQIILNNMNINSSTHTTELSLGYGHINKLLIHTVLAPIYNIDLIIFDSSFRVIKLQFIGYIHERFMQN